MNENLAGIEPMGQSFGITGIAMGKWLKNCGLRNEDGSPTRHAIDQKIAVRRWSPKKPHYSYSWNPELVLHEIRKHGFKTQEERKKEHDEEFIHIK